MTKQTKAVSTQVHFRVRVPCSNERTFRMNSADKGQKGTFLHKSGFRVRINVVVANQNNEILTKF